MTMKLGNDTLAFEDLRASSRDNKLDAVKNVIESANPRDAFFIGRSEDIENNLNFWTKKCPNILPYYDVSCNGSVLVLDTMARLGTKFSFRNRLELDQLLKAGIPGENLFFRSTPKVASHMRHASTHGVNLILFDNKDELKKIATNSSNCKAVFLTTKSVDNKDTFPNGHLEDMMATAQELGVEVVGVALNPDFNFFADRAAESLKKVVDCARKAGHNISILDLGEMFPIDDDLEDFEQKVDIVMTFVQHLTEIIPEPLTIIANPSKFVIRSAFCLAVRVLDTDVDQVTGKTSYIINEGIYGAFQPLLEHDDVLKPELVTRGNHSAGKILAVSDVVGPSRDILDIICTDCHMERCDVGDWIVFDSVGNLYMGDMNPVDINIVQLESIARGNDNLWFLSKDDSFDFLEDELFGIRNDHEDSYEDVSSSSQSHSDQIDDDDFIR